MFDRGLLHRPQTEEYARVEIDTGLSYLKSRLSTRPGEGKFYTQLLAYLAQNKKEQTYPSDLRRMNTHLSVFTPLIDPQRACVFSHNNKAQVYVGVPKAEPYDVIAVTGTLTARSCANAEIRTISNILSLYVEDLSPEEARKYFRINNWEKDSNNTILVAIAV